MTRALTLGIAAVLSLAGCGSGGGGGRTVTVATGKPVAVTARDYRFDPKGIVLSGAGAVRFELKNDGAQAHDLRVEKDGQDLGGTATFGPGQTQSATVKVAPGTYDFVCTVGDHEALGMKGKLTVK